jgi:hypothetical protein
VLAHLLDHRDLEVLPVECDDQPVEARQPDRSLPGAVAVQRMAAEDGYLLQLMHVPGSLDYVDAFHVSASDLVAIGADGLAGVLVLPLELVRSKGDLHRQSALLCLYPKGKDKIRLV